MQALHQHVNSADLDIRQVAVTVINLVSPTYYIYRSCVAARRPFDIHRQKMKQELWVDHAVDSHCSCYKKNTFSDRGRATADSRRRGLVSIPNQLWTKWLWNRFCSEFSCVALSVSCHHCFHTHWFIHHGSNGLCNSQHYWLHFKRLRWSSD
jgi:hypothetical protein